MKYLGEGASVCTAHMATRKTLFPLSQLLLRPVSGEFHGSPVVRALVQSLVGEIRVHKLCGAARRKKNQKGLLQCLAFLHKT